MSGVLKTGPLAGGVSRMQFEASELRGILRNQDASVEVKVFDRCGRMRGKATPAEALKLVSGPIDYFGVGTPRRILHLRPAVGSAGIGTEASVTTQGHRRELKNHHKRHCAEWNTSL